MKNIDKLRTVPVKEVAFMLDSWFELKPEIENAYCEKCEHNGCHFGKYDGCDISPQEIIKELLLQEC